ncbi:MAG TPA: thiamine phosphate synthase [Burkholderiaceae bacterium]|nr:thiamine phosphate synthase [Burkholderiaceae bacterium]
MPASGNNSAERDRAPRGIYVITPDWADTQRLVAAVTAAIRGGAAAVQYRNKAASLALQREQAEALAHITHSAGLPFFVDNDAALALAVGADGLHIGRMDGDPAEVRAKLPRAMMLGVSCYADLARVQTAMRAGASYVALGVMFPSQTKPDAAIAPAGIIGAARQRGAHVVASGGINGENIGSVAADGAQAVGVVSAVFDATEPERAAAELAARFVSGAREI